MQEGLEVLQVRQGLEALESLEALSQLPNVRWPAPRRGLRDSASQSDVEAGIWERGSKALARYFEGREVFIPDPPVPAPVPLAAVAVVPGRALEALPSVPNPRAHEVREVEVRGF